MAVSKWIQNYLKCLLTRFVGLWPIYTIYHWVLRSSQVNGSWLELPPSNRSRLTPSRGTHLVWCTGLLRPRHPVFTCTSNAYELLNPRALKISTLYINRIFMMDAIFMHIYWYDIICHHSEFGVIKSYTNISEDIFKGHRLWLMC